MRETVVSNLLKRFDAYADLVNASDDDTLQQRLDADKHKSLAEHLWCVVGSRESYARAIEAGAWAGFNCSMTSFSQQDFREALSNSAQAVRKSLDGVEDWSEERDALLASLAEHEVMHEGQIIRHVYGVGGELPESWVWA